MMNPDRIEEAVGGVYQLSDGKHYFVEGAMAKAITRRVMMTLPEIDAEVVRLRHTLLAINKEIDSLAGERFAPRVISALARIKQTSLNALGIGYEG